MSDKNKSKFQIGYRKLKKLDLGKMETYAVNPKTGQPTAHGHENKSSDYVHQFKDWIESIDGADINTVKYIVKNQNTMLRG